ncbi:MAG: hypothetical protein PHX21_11920 [bacterium]|nr:hypothetical protein [bacterium]
MKKRSAVLIIIGCAMAFQFNFFRITGAIQPSANWNWKYDISGMLSVIGAIIGIIGVISFSKAVRKSKNG